MRNSFIESSLKRWLKRKVKVTLGLMVAFMITGMTSYSEDITETVNIKVEENGKVVVTPDSVGKLEGNLWTNDGNIKVINTSGNGGNGLNIESSINEENKISITNNGIISGEVSNIYEAGAIGNGIYNAGIVESIINNGTLSGKSSKTLYIYPAGYTGNGIYNANIITEIINTGIISGEISDTEEPNESSKYSGNGIYNGDEIDTVANNGVISGTSKNTNGNNSTGNGIYNGDEIDTVINNGVISGLLNESNGSNSGNGIYNNRKITTLNNKGIISGKTLKITKSIDKAGNGIYSNSYNSEITTLNNDGLILGSSENEEKNVAGSALGNGIYNNKRKITTINNKGIISGKASNVERREGGNGIYSNNSEITTLNNDGIISGKFTGESSNKILLGNGISSNKKIGINNRGIISGSASVKDDKNEDSGNGIHISQSLDKLNLNNYGVIAGTNKAIYIYYNNGGNAFSKNNYGLLINGAGTENVSIESGAGGKVEDYTIMNTFAEGTITDISLEKEIRLSNSDNTNLIINGYNKGLTVDKNLTLSNSFINNYASGITIESGSLTGNNIIVNGGLAENNIAIKGSDGNNELILAGNSMLNGNVDLGNGDDKLTLSNNVQINGDLLGGKGNDTLTFVSDDTTKISNIKATTTEKNINILHNISGFNNMNIDTNVTLFENAKVTEVENINISSDGKLSLRLKEDETGEKATHSLSDNENLTIKGDIGNKTGEVEFITNGMGMGTIIDMNGISVNNVSVTTNSIIDGLSWDKDGNLVLDTTGELPDIVNPTTIKYETLNKIYQSIVSTNSDDNINKLKEVIGSTANLEDNEQNKYLIDYLSSIYAGTPYSYSTEISRKTLTMFDEIAIGKDLNPNLNSWAIYGGLTHTDGGNENTFYGKNYYGFDNKNTTIDADTKIYGGYAKAEYGKSENFTTGLIFGGNNSEVNLSNGSKLEGDSFYFGIYGKQKVGNLKLTAGIGVQHGDYKSDRTSGGYVSTNTSENYHDRGFNIYLDGRYSYALGNNFFLEPRMTINYNNIHQDGVTENGTLGIDVDSKTFETSSGTAGLDIKKIIPTETLIHELTLGVSYNTFFSGDDEKYLTGRFVGGNDFDMLVDEKEDTFSLNGKYEILTEKGFTFDIRGNYSFEHENTKDEWTIGTGIGYRF